MPTDRPDQSARDDATAVVRRLRDAGHVAYFAGGCVRDTLLGHTPKDYDVATDAPPQRVRQLFHNTQAVGAAFGVILVRLGRSTIEVATFRTDGTYTDGRRPDTVTFATAEEDAKRRDFTINGLFLDPLDGDRVIDYVGGRADLDAKLIRAIGNPDERFAEDHLRLLRAVRFAARLGFEIEPTTADAIRRTPRAARISPERIAEELRRMVVGGRQAAWRELQPSATGSTESFGSCPATGITRGLLAHPCCSGRATAVVRRDVGRRVPRLAVAASRAPDGRPAMADQGRGGEGRPRDAAGLKISNDEAAELEGTLLGAGAMLAEPEPGVAAKKRFLATPTATTRVFCCPR